MSGGNGKANYYGSINYTDDQSIIINSWIRDQSKINVGYGAGDFREGIAFLSEWETGNNVPIGTSARQVWEKSMDSIYRPDGSYASYVESKRNPVAQALFNVDKDNNYLVQLIQPWVTRS